MLGLVRAGNAGGGGRDLRADVFRGLALWFIFIDHVPGNVLGGFTLRNFALCDAAEAFVLLTGYARASPTAPCSTDLAGSSPRWPCCAASARSTSCTSFCSWC